MKPLLTIIALLLVIQTYSQDDEEKYALKSSDSIAIVQPKFQLTLKSVVENNYNDHFSSIGPEMIEFGGYSLSETLKKLGKSAKTFVQIEELKANPKIVITISAEMNNFQELWPSILTELANHYHFSFTEEIREVNLLCLHVSDEKKLFKATTKSNNPGMLKSSSTKGGVSFLVKYSLKDLGDWLEEPLRKWVTICDQDLPNKRFDFKLERSGNIRSTLLNGYGLELRETQQPSKTYIIR